MLDIKYIRENAEVVKKAVVEKHLSQVVDVDRLLELDAKHISLLKQVEIHRGLKNKLSEDISKVDQETRIKLVSEATAVKQELSEMEEKLKVLKSEVERIMLLVPNVIAPDVPEGKDDSENVVLRSWGEPKKFSFTPRDHVELGTKLDLIDTEKAAEVSGSRFVYLKNEAVLLQFAIIQFVFKTLTDPILISKIAQSVGNPFNNVFTPVVPPVLIKPEIMKRMDRLDPIEERYYIPGDPLVLVGSAEHTLGPLLMNETVEQKDLPIRYIGYSTAFRREAGTYGKDIKGIIRVHQFDKLEFETFVPQEFGDVEQKFLVALQEYFMQQLGIPYQVIGICSGDMGKPDYRQIDINSWMPSQGKYRETQTSDYMTDFQSRRLNSAYKGEDGARKYLYMNDATAIAIGRTLVAIMENYQEEDGSIRVPEILQKYVGIDKIKTRG